MLLLIIIIVLKQTDEVWANKAYQEAESYLRSKIPAFKNYAPPAMFNYPFYINDPKKTAEEDETNEGKFLYNLVGDPCWVSKERSSELTLLSSI